MGEKGRAAKNKFLAVAVALAACLGLMACAPQKAPETGESDGDSAAVAGPAWSIDMDCSVCHDAQHASMQDGALLAGAHLEQADVSCASCHADEAALSGVHEGKSADSPKPTKLKKTTVSTESCMNETCHAVSDEEFEALTAGVTELTDANGTMVNPHTVMGLTEGHADIQCVSCHTVHDQGATAAETCVTCHHAGVYECNTCH